MGLLALAGMVSGAGEGLRKAAESGMQFIGTSALQEQREKMELRRIQLMEDNAAAREQRGYAHSERLASDAQANARSMQQQGFAQSDKTLDKTQDFTSKENQLSREEHRADQAQARLIAERTLANAEAGTEYTREHQEATERIARAQLAAAKAEATLMPLADGSLMRVNAQGEILGKAMDPETGKPLQGTRDLPATTKLLVEVNKTMIQQKGEQLRNPSLLPEERNAINVEMTRLKGDIETLLGRVPDKPGATHIVDPAATIKAPETLAAKAGTTTPAPDADEYLLQMRQQTEQRAGKMKAATQRAGQAAMDAENLGAVAATSPILESEPPSTPPAPPRVAKMERQILRMQEPGEPSKPSSLLAAAQNPQSSTSADTSQAAALPPEMPRAATPTNMASMLPMEEPDIIDPSGPADPFVSNQAADVPRELQRAVPRTGLIARSKPQMPEPSVTDLDGPPVEPEATTGRASQQKRRALMPNDLQSLLTTAQKEAIVNMQRRVRSRGIEEKPATSGQLQDLLIKVLGPIYRSNGEGPGELAEGVNQMMKALLPEKPSHR